MSQTALSNMYLFKYNNYQNHILKLETTLQGYGTPLVALKDTNFNPNDYIKTQHVFNTWVLDATAAQMQTVPDYCIVCNSSDEIISRWFVMDVNRTRGGQWRISLLADLAADYKSALMGATCFIKKGYTNSSPFVFNNEQMGFNQILSDLIPLENNLKTPWLVLYLARYNNEGSYNKFTGSFADEPSIKETNYTLEKLEDYKFYNYVNQEYTAYDEDKIFFGAIYKIPYDVGTLPQQYDRYEMTQEFIAGDTGFKPKGVLNKAVNRTLETTTPTVNDPAALKGSLNHWQDLAGIFSTGLTSAAGNLPRNSYTSDPVLFSIYGSEKGPANVGTVSGFNELSDENDKTIKVGDDLYRIEVIRKSPPSANYGSYRINVASDLGLEMRADLYEYNNVNLTGFNPQFYVHFPLTYPILQLQITKIGSSIQQNPVTYDFGYTKAITTDAAYEIIAAPYNTVTFSETSIGPNFIHSGSVALQWFQNIINKYNSAGFAYDLQLVPYCPIDWRDLTLENVIYCQRGDAKLALAIQLTRSTFSTSLQISRFPWQSDLKLSNELDIYRLVSPNGVGEYEWSPAKNGKSIGQKPYFDIDCTLIPFMPYIKISPSYGGLYGKDFDDYRGLICSGDFSLPIVNSEWETYQLNNKYYQDIFDRQIENQETNNKYQRISEQVGAVTGTVSGALSGAAAGGMAGGPIGAAIGAVGGAIASAAGGVADLAINDALREEQLSYMKDQFSFNLQTIQARSQTLSRTTSFNANNKYFPYIEYYTCTEQEKQALIDKMKYDGMTIGVIGKIPDYMNPSAELTYIQGQIVEMEITADAAIARRLNEILQGGIRIKNE